mmetsp:Transcript_28267/g.42032  ORF Transcript_28267/g.42032 Transcript_28267/m.42032 type:complete len:124 (-) Transcript_28267:204-575(-)
MTYNEQKTSVHRQKMGKCSTKGDELHKEVSCCHSRCNKQKKLKKDCTKDIPEFMNNVLKYLALSVKIIHRCMLCAAEAGPADPDFPSDLGGIPHSLQFSSFDPRASSWMTAIQGDQLRQQWEV